MTTVPPRRRGRRPKAEVIATPVAAAVAEPEVQEQVPEPETADFAPAHDDEVLLLPPKGVMPHKIVRVKLEEAEPEEEKEKEADDEMDCENERQRMMDVMVALQGRAMRAERELMRLKKESAMDAYLEYFGGVATGAVLFMFGQRVASFF